MRSGRRELLLGSAATFASLTPGCREMPTAAAPKPPADTVAPTEDLMREHGLLDRVLLVYDECARRFEGGLAAPVDVLPASSHLVRTFVHAYHEQLEEEHVFPICERALVHMGLVRVLRDQHAIGRKITAFVEEASGKVTRKDDRKRLASALRAFARMYRPHAAREDTVLFPALRDLVRPDEYSALGARFEQREHELFGDDGFARKVAEVGELETALEIQDLARMSAEDFR